MDMYQIFEEGIYEHISEYPDPIVPLMDYTYIERIISDICEDMGINGQHEKEHVADMLEAHWQHNRDQWVDIWEFDPL